MKNKEKILYALLAVAIIARVFVLAQMPEFGFNDSLYHLKLIQNLVQTGRFEAIGGIPLPPPAYHYLSAGFFTITGLPVEMPWVKILPIILSILEIALAFALLKKIFPNKYLLGLVFVVSSAWLTIFSSVNYPDMLASVCVLAGVYALFEIFRGKKHWWIIPLTASTSVLMFSKANGFLIAPVFVVAVGCAVLKECLAVKKIGKKQLVGVLLFLSLLFIALHAAQFAFVMSAEDITESPNALGFPKALDKVAWLAKAALNSGIDFWGFPFEAVNAALEKTGLINLELLIKAIIVVVLLPLYLVLLKGLKKMINAKNIFYLIIVAVMAVNFLINLASFYTSGTIYTRYFLPSLALLAIPLTLGFENLESDLLKKAFLASFALMVLASAVYGIYLANHNNETFRKHEGLYDFLDTLPQDSKLIGNQQGRQVNFYTGLECCLLSTYDPKAEIYNIQNGSEVKELLVNNGCTHIALTCYKNPWSKDLIERFAREGFFKKVFEDDCGTVYEVGVIE